MVGDEIKSQLHALEASCMICARASFPFFDHTDSMAIFALAARLVRAEISATFLDWLFTQLVSISKLQVTLSERVSQKFRPRFSKPDPEMSALSDAEQGMRNAPGGEEVVNARDPLTGN